MSGVSNLRWIIFVLKRKKEKWLDKMRAHTHTYTLDSEREPGGGEEDGTQISKYLGGCIFE